jgi:hypothetical protein
LLLQPLRTAIARPASVPRDLEHAVAPLRWVLEQAHIGIPLDDEWGAAIQFSDEGSTKFGWNPRPKTECGGRAFTEIDSLHFYARDLALVHRVRRRDVLTPLGDGLAGDPAALWRRAAGGLVVRGRLMGALRELALASLLQPEEIDDKTAAERMCDAVSEAGSATDYVREFGVSFDEIVAEGMVLFFTLGRGLRMFDRSRSGAFGRVQLSEFGRATAIEALRASAFRERGKLLGRPVLGAWN